MPESDYENGPFSSLRASPQQLGLMLLMLLSLPLKKTNEQNKTRAQKEAMSKMPPVRALRVLMSVCRSVGLRSGPIDTEAAIASAEEAQVVVVLL